MPTCSLQAMIDAFPENTAITDAAGRILFVNRAWRAFGERNDLCMADFGLGRNYLEALDDSAVSVRLRQGFADVVDAAHAVVEVEYPCHGPHGKAWYVASLSRLDLAEGPIVIIAHRDVTSVKAPEIAIKNVLFQTIAAITGTLERKDPYTFGHQNRVALLAALLARRLGLDHTAVEGVWFGALIHDVGKIAVPAEILNRPGRLRPLEMELVKEHPEIGYDLLKPIAFPWPVAEVVRQHHERMDGSGYPQGLRGDAILPAARIVAVADVVDAMITHRPYRAGLSKATTMEELTRGRGTAFDADVVDVCLAELGRDAFRIDAIAPPDQD